MIGVIINTMAVLVGSLIGLLLKKGIPERISSAIMKGIGLCTIYIGIVGTLKGKNPLILILSITIGVIIGQGLDLDDKLNRFVLKLENRFKKDNQKTSITEGFITASLLFCVGAMTLVGSLQAGLSGNYDMLYMKATLDLVSSIVFASALGIGVLFSAVLLFAVEGSIVLLANFVAPILTDTVIAEMTCAGSLLILALGLNLLGVTKLKIMNYMPAILLPILLCQFIR